MEGDKGMLNSFNSRRSSNGANIARHVAFFLQPVLSFIRASIGAGAAPSNTGSSVGLIMLLGC
jgi:hypothetical protein